MDDMDDILKNPAVEEVRECTAVEIGGANGEMAASVAVVEAVEATVRKAFTREGREATERMVNGNTLRRLELLMMPLAMAILDLVPQEKAEFNGTVENSVTTELSERKLGRKVIACANSKGGLTMFFADEWTGFNKKTRDVEAN
jgi:hypothetical protein